MRQRVWRIRCLDSVSKLAESESFNATELSGSPSFWIGKIWAVIISKLVKWHSMPFCPRFVRFYVDICSFYIQSLKEQLNLQQPAKYRRAPSIANLTFTQPNSPFTSQSNSRPASGKIQQFLHFV